MTRVALVLGAGGITGHAFHAGVLRAIEEATGWDPRAADLVVGTSAGSIVGAALRAGLSAHDLHARATGEPLSLEGERLLAEVPPPGSLGDLPRRRRRVPAPASPGLVVRQLLRPWRARPSLVMAGLLPEGRLDIGTVADEMRHLTAVAGRLVDDLWVTAVRLDDGRRVAFGRPGDPTAPVADAVAASCAIPGIMAQIGRAHV